MIYPLHSGVKQATSRTRTLINLDFIDQFKIIYFWLTTNAHLAYVAVYDTRQCQPCKFGQQFSSQKVGFWKMKKRA